jgi:gamma-glutamyltranspeptidase/glutathione hydrolase
MYSFLYGEMAVAAARLGHHPSGRERYFPHGYLPTVGSIWRQPRLAATLRRIAAPDGVTWFQEGEFAELFVAAVREAGGAMTVADLAEYEPRWDEPTHFRFRGHDLLGSPPPDTGGPYVAFVLGLLDQLDLDQHGPWMESPRALALIARTLALADDQVERYCHDPRAFDLPLEHLLSSSNLAMQARILESSFPCTDLTPPTPGTHSSHVPDHGDPAKSDSNQLTIVDEAGNWLTMLHTVYGSPFGTGLVVDGVGVNTGNGFPGVATGPGRRIVTPLASLMAIRDGVPWLALGTPSYPPPYIALTLLNLLGYGMTLIEAIEAPRFRLDPAASGPQPAWAIGKLTAETRIPEATIAGLRRFGMEFAPLGDFNWHVGSVQAVMRDPEGPGLLGAADSRRGGFAAGY